jgi:tryptophanyl-tRNA synthetase
MAFLALGLDPKRAILFRQSDIPEVTELYWILGRSFRSPTSTGDQLQGQARPRHLGGLRPLLLPGADGGGHPPLRLGLVPVGKDQVQHLEFARDWATKFNVTYVPGYDPRRPRGDEDRAPGHPQAPEALVQEATAVVPGTDGQKMSKSYNNTIDLFGTRPR